MMTLLSIAVCIALFVKLTFFTDLDRRNSRLFYRVILFLTTVYTAYQIIYGLYGLEQPSPWRVVMHLAMFVGAFFLKPEHLPWNQK